MAVIYGRTVNHDARSWEFQADRAPQVKSVTHSHFGPVLNQGQLGSCTGNAATQCMNTDPFRSALAAKKVSLLDERHAVAIYSWATHHDEFSGAFPPNDTGSSGLGVGKALKSLKLISAYRHAFGLQHTLEALTLKPVIIGTPWTDEMETPDSDGTIHYRGTELGGHETCLVGVDVERQRVRGINSWGENWGDKGFYWLSFTDLDALLHNQGDCTVFDL